MRKSRSAKSTPLKRALYICFALYGSQVVAQPITTFSENFDYYYCGQKFEQEDIKGFYNGIKAAVEVYNSQDDVDVKMEMPNIHQCYVAVGRKGTLFGGVPFVKFYTSTAHFQCSVDGNCVGDLAGYDASMAAINNGLQFTANTYRVDDLVNLCFRNGELRGGRC